MLVSHLRSAARDVVTSLSAPDDGRVVDAVAEVQLTHTMLRRRLEGRCRIVDRRRRVESALCPFT